MKIDDPSDIPQVASAVIGDALIQVFTGQSFCIICRMWKNEKFPSNP
jgi:hypothetical protein